MIHNIFTIYDEKAAAYLPPFFLPTDGMAIRTFSSCINSPDHQFGAHPQDYTLFKLGQYDDNTAELISSTRTISLGNGVEFITPAQPDQSELLGDEKISTPTKVGDEPPIQSSPESGNSA